LCGRQNFRGIVRLAERCRLPKAHVTVQVIDASIMDAVPPVLAETVFECLTEGLREIPFVLNAPVCGLGGRDVRLFARVAADAAGNIAPGDYLTMESVQFVPGRESGHELEVAVRKVNNPDA